MSEEKVQDGYGEFVRNGFGRIEVVPEILMAIAQRTALHTEGVFALAEIPSSLARRHSRKMRERGILLDLENGVATFDLFLILKADVNMMETSRKVQEAIIERIDTMVGIAVHAVNIHVEDVSYAESKT